MHLFTGLNFLLLQSQQLFACSSCYAKNSDKVVGAYLFSTALMGAIPLVFILGTFLYLRKKSRQQKSQIGEFK